MALENSEDTNLGLMNSVDYPVVINENLPQVFTINLWNPPSRKRLLRSSTCTDEGVRRSGAPLQVCHGQCSDRSRRGLNEHISSIGASFQGTEFRVELRIQILIVNQSIRRRVSQAHRYGFRKPVPFMDPIEVLG